MTLSKISHSILILSYLFSATFATNDSLCGSKNGHSFWFGTDALSASYHLNNSFQNVSTECVDSLYVYGQALLEGEDWAVEMFDAFGKIPSSILRGTVMDFGSLDDCKKIKLSSNEGLDSFKAQFCVVGLKHPLFQPARLRTSSGRRYLDAFGHQPHWVLEGQEFQDSFGLYLGICLPSTCSEHDLHYIINTYVGGNGFNISVSDCQTEEPGSWPLLAKISMSFMICLIITCVSGTILDIMEHYRGARNSGFDWIKSFSVYTNGKKLFKMDARENELDFVHGVKACMCLSILLAHLFFFPTHWKEQRFKNLYHVFQVVTPELLIFNNGTIIIGGFFFISSFLTSYAAWNRPKSTGGSKKGVFKMVIQRYCRMTPPSLILIVLGFAMPVFGSGPVWNSTWENINQNCVINGWRNLLYIQNFGGYYEICWLHTWFLAVGFQMALISAPLMIIASRSPKACVALALLLVSGCVYHDYEVSVRNEYLFGSFNASPVARLIIDMVNKIYMLPSHHLASHLLGMMTAKIAVKYRSRKVKKEWQLLAWVVSAILCLTSAYAVYYPTKNLKVTGIYNATRNIVFSLSLIWVIYACVAGMGGILHKFLTLKMLVPISRLSYSIFLIQSLVLVYRDADLRDRVYMDRISFVTEFMAVGALTLVCAVIFNVIVEEPFAKLNDLWKAKDQQQPTTNQSLTKERSTT